jgi:integrase/recombinase XerC
MCGGHPGDAALIERHLRQLRLAGRSPGTVYARERALRRMQRALPGGLAAAAAADLQAWRASLAVSPDTAAHYVAHAREFYRWLAAEGIREDNPALPLPSPPSRRRLPRPISSGELAAAVATAPPRVRLILVLAAWCGLRAQEIARLRREAVLDTARPPVLLVELEAAKGGRRERVIPLHPFVLGELRALPMPASGWLVPRRDGRPGPCAPWRISQLAGRHLHASGSPATLHQLRHWFGTEAYRARRDLRVVQELLGHASPATTAGYAAYDRAEAAAAVAALPVPSALRPLAMEAS